MGFRWRCQLDFLRIIEKTCIHRTILDSKRRRIVICLLWCRSHSIIWNDPWLWNDFHSIGSSHTLHLISSLSHFEVLLWWNFIVLSQTVDKSLPEFTHSVWLVIVTQSTISTFNIRVSTRSIIVILNWLWVQIWLLLSLKKLFVS